MEMLERLQTLRVQDAMSPDTISVDRNESLGSAAVTMTRRSISGLPVVDEASRCVGMLTAFDFVRRYAADKEEERAARGGEEFRLTKSPQDQSLQVEPAAGDMIGSNMTSGVQSITKDAPLLEAARVMCAAHIHRLPVLDAHGQVEGIITSLDIAAAVVNAADEKSDARKPRVRS
jgi:CBS domain-containing protein